MKLELTSHRRTVLDVVKGSHDHPTAKEIFNRAIKKAPALSFATVYNSLKYLTQHGYLREVIFGDGVFRYDALLEPHHHLVCRGCGRVDDFEKAAIPISAKKLAAPDGFHVEEVAVTLRGLCAECRKKNKS